MTQMQAAIAANRFGLGARPGELDRIGADHESWLLDQLRRDRLPELLQKLPTSEDVLSDLDDLQSGARAARQTGDADGARQAQQTRREYLRERYREQATRRYEVAATTNEPFRERLVHFWTNHFAVSADKLPLPALAGTLENEAIRPRVSGPFADLLIAVEQHPAMILYLDNQTSMGPNSDVARAAARRGRDRGLNENLAREILELHTLGVDGGYAQQDVTTFANVLTGWSIGGGPGQLASGPVGQFYFRPGMHEPGAKTLLGRRYSADGVRQGEAVLRDLAAHRSTARFLATKLARHFTADEPPPELVDRLTAAYVKNDGELGAVYRVLIESAEPWAQPLTKYKTPQDFLISTYRAFGQVPDNPERMLSFLELLGQRPYTPGSPAGWPDGASHWDSSDALIRRIEWGAAVGRVVGDRVDPVELGDEILGPLFSDHTRASVAGAESAVQGLTLLLASPEFQRR